MTTQLMDKYPIRNRVFMCDGCKKAKDWTATGWKCSAWKDPDKVYAIRVFNECPLNQVLDIKKKFKRVGQQKQAKRGR